MKKKHEKSACCRGVVRRFGGRRRQCTVCKRTWSLWHKRRGRKKIRVASAVVHRYLMNGVAPLRMRRSRTRTETQLQYRLTRSRALFLKTTPWPTIPPNIPLITVADAMVRYIGRCWYTWYFIFVRPQGDDRARILPPVVYQGTETQAGWRKAFAEVPEVIRSRIVALVCDGHRGLVLEAKWQQWLLQRCHFHLIARVQARRSKWYRSRHRDEGKRVYALVKEILNTPLHNELLSLLTRLEDMAVHTTSPELRSVLLGFINHVDDYRTFLRYPKLNLPITNNTAEAFIGLVTALTSRTRGFRTVRSLHAWICALVKLRKMIRCRGFHQQN